MKFHLAQINIARAKAPMDSPVMAGFVNALDEVNAIADRSPGFVWRLQTASGNATDVRAYDDPQMLVNLTVWESPEALRAYVYQSLHRKFFARREEWFEQLAGAHVALWWIPSGTIPDILDAKARLEHLERHGESPRAFTFGRLFGPDGQPV